MMYRSEVESLLGRFYFVLIFILCRGCLIRSQPILKKLKNHNEEKSRSLKKFLACNVHYTKTPKQTKQWGYS